MIKAFIALVLLSAIIYGLYFLVREYKLYSFIAKSIAVIVSAALILTVITYIF